MQDELKRYLYKWNLTAPVQVADTGHAVVWKVQQANSQPVALKIYRRANRGNEGPGASLLRAWQNRGAVGFLDEDANALLMEWLDGPSLGQIARDGNPDMAITQLAETAGRLHCTPTVQVSGLTPLKAVFAPLVAARFGKNCSDSLRRDIIRAAVLAEELLDSAVAHVPLHGDLHPDNVILTDKGPKAIDAKGYIGDPAFELANALRHPKGMPGLVRQPGHMQRVTSLYAGAMAVKPVRLLKWAAAKCALSIFWRSGGEVGDDPEADLLRLFLDAA